LSRPPGAVGPASRLRRRYADALRLPLLTGLATRKWSPLGAPPIRFFFLLKNYWAPPLARKSKAPAMPAPTRAVMTKIHVIVDALGNPLRLVLTGGQVHDITQAETLLASIEPRALLRDKGYDADHFADSLTARAIKVVIPPKSNRKVKRDCDFALSIASAISSRDSSV
jgi:DDE family transposase